MISAPDTRISVPPEPVANQILQDPIFGHLSSMWNNIETSQELSLRHQTNEIALVQGAASVGIPIDVMRKTMERVADQHGEDLANRLLARLQRPESMTTSVLSGPPPPPPPGAGGVSVGPDAPMTADMMVGTEEPGRYSVQVGTEAPGTRSMQVGTEAPGTHSIQVGTDTQMRDAKTGPDDVEMVATSGGRPPSPPGFGQRLMRQPGYSVEQQLLPHTHGAGDAAAPATSGGAAGPDVDGADAPPTSRSAARRDLWRAAAGSAAGRGVRLRRRSPPAWTRICP
jgi:hypothetical protein